MIFKISIFLVILVHVTTTSTTTTFTWNPTLTVFNLNTWGLSWFDNVPNVLKHEPYDLKSVMDTYFQTMRDNYPNPKMIDMMKKVPQNRLIKMLNPARKKKERFEAICQHLKDNDFDVVFLQEVWFEKDYEFLKECLNGTGYKFSNFDSECGTNSMSLVGCSGLVTMSRYQLSNEMTSPLPKGELYTTLSKPEDLMSYIQFGIQRKVLIHDLFVDDVCTIRLVNTHFSPSDTFSALRERQAREVIRNLDTTTKYNMTVLGMDLNDEPFQNSHWTASYRVFKNANFSDGFNEEFDTNMAYPVTFADETNSWTTKNSKTLDYIMVLPHEIDVENNGHVIVQEAGFVDIAVQDLKTTNGHSFSEHNSVNATIWLQYY